MAMIHVKELSFYYDGSYDTIFNNVSFQMDTNWKLGFVGRNGRGKTTFLKLLMGEYAYKGSISSPVQFQYFPFPVQNEWDTALEIVQGICGSELWQIKREMALLEVEEDVLHCPFGTLSGGEKTKVLLVALFLQNNKFLLIDEPTNHLDTAARALLARYLNNKKSFILVSHDRLFLDGCVDHVLSINKADIQVQRGNFSTWQENRSRQDGFERMQNEKLKKDIHRLDAAAKRTANWSDKVEKSKRGERVAGLRPDRGNIGHKAAKMMKRSKTTETRRQKAVEDKAGLLKNVETAEELFFQPLRYHTDRLAQVENLGVAYGGRVVVQGLNLSVGQGERIALTGKNGCGKTSVLKLFAGLDVPHTGEVRLSSRLVVSYVPQNTSFLRGGLGQYAQQCGIDESLFKAMLRKLNFERVQFEKDMAELSEGQRKKVLLARSLCQQAHLYIWDEPLNFIDVLSRVQIEQAIARSLPSMLFVEHDIAFVQELATRVVRM